MKYSGVNKYTFCFLRILSFWGTAWGGQVSTQNATVFTFWPCKEYHNNIITHNALAVFLLSLDCLMGEGLVLYVELSHVHKMTYDLGTRGAYTDQENSYQPLFQLNAVQLLFYLGHVAGLRCLDVLLRQARLHLIRCRPLRTGLHLGSTGGRGTREREP